jgi:serine/threonine protein kinase
VTEGWLSFAWSFSYIRLPFYGLTGTFGQVWLVSRTNSDGAQKVYALKIQSKYELCENGQARAVVHEKNIMAQLRHPFISDLAGSFQVSQNTLLWRFGYTHDHMSFSRIVVLFTGRVRRDGRRKALLLALRIDSLLLACVVESCVADDSFVYMLMGVSVIVIV